MAESTIIDPGAIARIQTEEALETLLREGARRLLQEALELEVQQYIDRFQQGKDEKGHRLVVRNGHLPPRDLVTGQGKIPVRQPQVHDRRPHARFNSANLLDKLPKRLREDAMSVVHEMYLAPTRKLALAAYERFKALYQDRYSKAWAYLKKDEEVLFRFYDFPAAQWVHLRTTNPIESTFATVRHRTRQTKGFGSRVTTLTMVFELALEAEKH